MVLGMENRVLRSVPGTSWKEILILKSFVSLVCLSKGEA